VGEGVDRPQRVMAILGITDLGQHAPGRGLGRGGQGVEDVGHLVDLMPNSA
jgi:hypothetical protein